MNGEKKIEFLKRFYLPCCTKCYNNMHVHALRSQIFPTLIFLGSLTYPNSASCLLKLRAKRVVKKVKVFCLFEIQELTNPFLPMPCRSFLESRFIWFHLKGSNEKFRYPTFCTLIECWCLQSEILLYISHLLLFLFGVMAYSIRRPGIKVKFKYGYY